MTGGDDDAVEALSKACEEAKGTLDHQLGWMQQMDSKAVKILRATLLLIGLLLTALSLSVRADSVDVSEFVNLFTIAGGLTLVCASMGAAVTYIASSFEAGLGYQDLAEALEDGYDEKKLYEQLAEGYATWIRFNQYVLQYNAILLTMTIICVINAITLLTAGAVVGSLQVAFTRPSIVAFFGLLVILAVIDYLIYKSEDVVIWYFDTREPDQ